MVLERLINPKKITGKPWELCFIGVLYATISAALSYWIFQSYASLVMVTFTAIATIPFIFSAVESEEKKSRTAQRLTLFKEHNKLLGLFGFLFLGFVIAFSGLYLLLPQEMSKEMFKAQNIAIQEVNSSPTGNFISSLSSIKTILSNNLGLLLFCLIFSFFYGVGAIFILSWNASVMAAAIGNAIYIGLAGAAPLGFFHIPLSFIRYSLHGFPEIAAYFVAGLAGGLLSVAFIKEGPESKSFIKVSQDSFHLITFAVVLLALSALVEVFISLKLV